MASENKRRDAEPPESSYDVYVTRVDDEGNRVEIKVSKVGIRLRGKHKPHADVVVRAGVLGFDRSTKSRLQICSVILCVAVLYAMRVIRLGKVVVTLLKLTT